MSNLDRKEGQALKEGLPSLIHDASLGRLPLQKLAVTGGIASGKSTVVSFLADLGLETISADIEAKRVRQDANAMADLAVLLETPSHLSTEHLRELLRDQDKRRIINRFFHGQVWGAIRRSPAAVVEVPLLLESCLWPFFDHIWCVSCPLDLRKKRLLERGMDLEQIAQVLSIQVHDGAREAISDCIFDGSKPLDDLKSQVLTSFQLLPHGIRLENRL